MTTPESRLRRVISGVRPKLEAITEHDASLPRAPGRWSRKEIVGHLIDSASNNHQRFVRAQFTNDLVFPGYDQDGWVSAQRYGIAPWSSLVTLFAEFNLHLARVIESIPQDVRTHARMRHNLHEIAFTQIPASEPTTLEYFMGDYVVHLEHHLAQIFEG
ncbi:MAG: DinB family protein [Gemmatimonadota bacterium]|nr:DinB family protein [Gemmatimonadota bacterium]